MADRMDVYKKIYKSSIYKSYKNIVKFFARIGIRFFPHRFQRLKREILQSSLAIVFETYLGRMLFIAFLSFLIVFLSLFLTMMFTAPFWFSFITAFVLAVISSVATLLIFYLYPINLLTSRKNSIDANLPFAMNHMGAIAASGVPPHVMFKLLTDVHEYGEIANEAKAIVRNVEAFGMDITSAIRQVASRTPSAEFRQFLNGVSSTIATGGDLRRYIENAAKEALADYKLKRERYLSTLSTYADFYTAVLIAAPLFFISILSVMAIIGGQLFGMSIPVAMNLGIYILLPILNIAFIAFIHFTQPPV